MENRKEAYRKQEAAVGNEYGTIRRKGSRIKKNPDQG